MKSDDLDPTFPLQSENFFPFSSQIFCSYDLDRRHVHTGGDLSYLLAASL